MLRTVCCPKGSLNNHPELDIKKSPTIRTLAMLVHQSPGACMTMADWSVVNLANGLSHEAWVAIFSDKMLFAIALLLPIVWFLVLELLHIFLTAVEQWKTPAHCNGTCNTALNLV
jgi:hypothetical protein